MDKSSTSIPKTKVSRAMRITKAGFSVGKQYVKHYTKKIWGADDKNLLHEKNAEDIYSAFSELKGSALKIAQMMSMDENLLPEVYANKFQQAQYSAPPLSYPLVVRTFNKYFKKTPTEIFDTFSKKAVYAASIGQVHRATLDGKKMAVKVQYPGVSDSITSDIRMIKPLAIQFFRLNKEMVNEYSLEVQKMLLEETNYLLELQRGVEIAEACKHIKGLVFPQYYKKYSCSHILTMDWLEGLHLSDFLRTNPTQEDKNIVGQLIWDFYHYQIHTLGKVHADPHPGNFLFMPEGNLGVVDFGCVKTISQNLYKNYFAVLNGGVLHKKEVLRDLLFEMNYLHKDDEASMQELLTHVFIQITSILSEPFQKEYFDFGDELYFKKIYDMSKKLSTVKELKSKDKHRGYTESLYLNRTHFGMYTLLGKLKAHIHTKK